MTWEQARKQALLVAGYRCQIQGQGCHEKAAHVHHKRSRRFKEGANDPDNLMALCAVCHEWVHNHPALSYERDWLRHAP